MQYVYTITGTLILLAVAVDLSWTALGTHGGGPLTGRLTSGLWKFAVAIHRRRPHHRLLSFVGTIFLVGVLGFWLGSMWAGWVLVFRTNPDAVVNAKTQVPADLPSLVYYVGYTMFTMGNGDFTATTDFWRILTAVACVSGIGGLTIAVTFLLQVLTAVVEKRALGAYISDIGDSPRQIISRAWDGERLVALDDHLVNLAGLVHMYAEQHLAYPVTHYFHAEQIRAATTLRLAVLNETLLLLTEGVAPHLRLPPLVTGPIRHALQATAEIVRKEFIDPAKDAPAPPDLAILRDLGIATVDDATFRQRIGQTQEIRRAFKGLVQQDGWKWEYVNDPPAG